MKEEKEMLRTLPLGLSSSMATMVAGGPDRDSLHSGKEEKKRIKTFSKFILSSSHTGGFGGGAYIEGVHNKL